MLGKTTTALLIASLSGCHPAFAEAPCEYDKTVETNWTQQIEKTSNIDKKVFPYVDDTRKCVMTREIDISQKIANLSLGTKRNDIAILNMKISIISISLSFGSLVASIFGMNVKNSYEDSYLAFIILNSIIVFLFIISLFIWMIIYKKKFN